MSIIRKTVYSGEHKEKIQAIYKELGKEAEYVGEDGDMVCRATTPKGALAKFKRRVRDDVDDFTADEYTLEEIGTGYLFLVDPDNKAHTHMIDESEWYVHWGGKEESDYPVYTYTI